MIYKFKIGFENGDGKKRRKLARCWWVECALRSNRYNSVTHIARIKSEEEASASTLRLDSPWVEWSTILSTTAYCLRKAGATRSRRRRCREP
jgi:hypothetical protein